MRGASYHIVVHKEGALDSKQFRVPRWAARLMALGAGLLVFGLVMVSLLYGPIVGAAGQVPLLRLRISQLEQENARVIELAQRLDEMEARYAQLRNMLGDGVRLPEVPTEETRDTQRLFVAPPITARLASPADTSLVGLTIPRRWPLSVRSFRTRGLAAGDSVETHFGLDLAVPVGSDVRAAGGGVVRNSGTDPAYGLYVLLVHTDGYETMYGHLSRVLVLRGDTVRIGQVIALSGNSGRSTAPHLHFEIRRDGQSIDPLALVREGS
jgi:murein DD-endopeptidase MepM/ murein hydrolase activator NlpD